jgi:hypothetical protein
MGTNLDRNSTATYQQRLHLVIFFLFDSLKSHQAYITNKHGLHGH